MMPVVQSYLDELTKNDMKYFPIEEQDGETVVTVGIALSNTNIRVMVIFDADGKSAAIRCYGLLRVTQEQFPMALLACNELNKQKRWVKFLIDDDNDVNLEDDAVIDEATAGPELLELVFRMCSIAEDAYPVLNKAIWM
ncbi:MAG: YbjN domain-containing protein [Lachnospiraceae bacterium]|nr:YbjN domain-containing protein [Lachnospiraceae bacterium]